MLNVKRKHSWIWHLSSIIPISCQLFFYLLIILLLYNITNNSKITLTKAFSHHFTLTILCRDKKCGATVGKRLKFHWWMQRSDVYYLPPVSHVHIKVRMKFSASEYPYNIFWNAFILSFMHSFIPLAWAECDDSLPFSEASSIPLCYVFFPAILLHQLFFHPLSPHLTIHFLV